jgi:hypothetical protein
VLRHVLDKTAGRARISRRPGSRVKWADDAEWEERGGEGRESEQSKKVTLRACHDNKPWRQAGRHRGREFSA